jgi:flagellar basal-body rod protein FlgF
VSEAIALIESAMRADAEALRLIGQNIANAEVTAYRRQIPLSSVGYSQIATEMERSENALSTGVAIDPQPGTLRATGETFHIAIEGSGYFAVQSPAGIALTRRGDFRVNAQGMLTSASGHPVMGTSGPLLIGASSPVISTDGTVSVDDEVIGQLQIVQVAPDAQLQYLGEGMYAAASGVLASNDGYGAVRQGFLETSNVTPVGEMVQLMETLRHFEASQRFVRGYDQMMEKAISELGKIG